MSDVTDPRVEAAARAMCLSHVEYDDLVWNGMSEKDKRFYRETVEVILKAADAAAWRPIESAPKDGETAFDIWVTSKEGGYRIANVMRANEVWVFDLMEWPDEMVPATHWMPLPHPPEAKP